VHFEQPSVGRELNKVKHDLDSPEESGSNWCKKSELTGDKSLLNGTADQKYLRLIVSDNSAL
jgi:hypothetical protein